jgi:lysophospholipase L1-like esterase
VKRRTVVALALYHLFVAFIQMGFLFHRSANPVVHHWSWVSLGLFTVTGLPHALPWALRFSWRRLGPRGFAFSLAPLVAGALALWIVGSWHYYWTRTREFDPFLQVPPENFKEAEPDAIRVLTLGGSTTECGELPAEARYPRVLERVLRERHPGIPIQVLNAGKPGYTSKHSLIAYATYYRAWQPDIVVVMHTANDIYRSFSPPRHSLGRRYNQHYSHYYGAAGDAANPPSFERHLLRRLHLDFDAIWYDSVRTKLVDYGLDRYSSFREHRNHLGELLDQAAGDGAALVVVSEPFLYKPNLSPDELAHLHMGYTLCRDAGNWWKIRYPSHRSLELAMRAFNASARDIARSRDATFADAEANVEKSLKSFVDDVHYTPDGAASVARVVADAVTGSGEIARRAARRGLVSAAAP